MKSILLWLTVGIALIIGIYALILLYREYKKATAKTPDDDLYDLHWRIESALINEVNELTLINMIKELKQRKDIDQKRLEKLDIKFRQRFQVLHP